MILTVLWTVNLCCLMLRCCCSIDCMQRSGWFNSFLENNFETLLYHIHSLVLMFENLLETFQLATHLYLACRIFHSSILKTNNIAILRSLVMHKLNLYLYKNEKECINLAWYSKILLNISRMEKHFTQCAIHLIKIQLVFYWLKLGERQWASEQLSLGLSCLI